MRNDNKEIEIKLKVKEWREICHFLNILNEDYLDFDTPLFLRCNELIEIIAKAIYDYE